MKLGEIITSKMPPQQKWRIIIIKMLKTTSGKKTLAAGLKNPLEIYAGWKYLLHQAVLKDPNDVRNHFHDADICAYNKDPHLVWPGWDIFQEVMRKRPNLLAGVQELINMIDFPEHSPYPKYLFVRDATRADNERLLQKRQQ